jgi:hypothetical protein
MRLLISAMILLNIQKMNNPNLHTFHIPVLGIGYSIDTPVKVARFGISSVISVMDDRLYRKNEGVSCQ